MSSVANIVWLGLGLIGFAFLAPSLKSGPSTETGVAAKRATSDSGQSPAPSTSIGNGLARREIIRAPDGHFYLDAQVNGAHVHFLVDTGASMVALSTDDAQRAGIALPSERLTAQGAGGAVEVMPVTIERIAVGPLEARGVDGAIAPQLPVSLLGQSFLSRIGTVEIRDDRMTLR